MNKLLLLSAVLMMPLASEPVFPTINNVQTRGEADWVEVAIKTPTATTPVYERVDLLSEFGAYQPSTTDVDLKLYVNSSGKSVTLKSSLENGGNIDIATASHGDDPVFKKLLQASKLKYPATYKAHYVSMAIVIQGQATIKDRGMIGDQGAIPQWGFSIQTMTADYVDNAGNLIA
ncbi:hypothetical protein CTI14_13600 [Methylobacterium radiotolerans]|nr:hypothetical protein CTI14_13600 [Methylobacterium radiotolerans]